MIAAPAIRPASMELLAPAGTLAAFEAALAAGADAVYVGAPGLNARALARDFTFAEIGAMVRYAHDRGRRVYVALNSLVKEGELPLAAETLEVLGVIRPDALIIQDPGILRLLRRHLPGMPVHASTLMTAANSAAVRCLGGLGFKRVVLARELALEEIRAIHGQVEVELEIFIHGAMCFSYSGLCRFSSLHGGKSSLRGQCVQPCRRRYDWQPSGKRAAAPRTGRGGYLFSMNDLDGLDSLAAAAAAGVVSLKIEGRLKSVAYVDNVVRAYRLALDALTVPPDQRDEMLAAASRHLEASMGRKRSSGFLVAGREQRLISPHLSGSSGTLVGRVVRAVEVREKKGGLSLQVALQEMVRVGDRLRLYDEMSGERLSFTLRSLEAGGRRVDEAGKGQTVRISLAGVEAAGLRHAVQGLLFRVDVSGRSERRSPALAREAVKEVPVPPDRRLARAMLAELLVEPSHRPARPGSAPGGLTWWARIPSMEALRQRFPFQVSRVVLDLTPANLEQFLAADRRRRPGHLEPIWALPPIIDETRLTEYRDAIARLRLRGSRAFQIAHLGQLDLFPDRNRSGDQEAPELFGDATLNVLNSAALRFWAEAGLLGVQFSLETDRTTLAASLADLNGPSPSVGTGDRLQVGLQVYGRPALFTARLDAPHFQGQRSLVSSRGERFYLERRPEALYVLPHLPFSLLAHVGELTRLGLSYAVVDLRHGQLKRECAAVAALLSGRGELPEVFSGNYAGILA